MFGVAADFRKAHGEAAFRVLASTAFADADADKRHRARVFFSTFSMIPAADRPSRMPLISPCALSAASAASSLVPLSTFI